MSMFKEGQYVSCDQYDFDIAKVISIDNDNPSYITLLDYDTNTEYNVGDYECENILWLPDILKNHISEKFYSPFCGWCILKSIQDNGMLIFDKITLRPNGKFHKDGKFGIFPNNDYDAVVFDNTNYDDYIEIWQNFDPSCGNISVGWDDLVDRKETTYVNVTINNDKNTCIGRGACNADALLKIKQLIHKYYGGNPTVTNFYEDSVYYIDSTHTICTADTVQHIAFHTYEYAEKFMQNQGNIALIDNFYN